MQFCEVKMPTAWARNLRGKARYPYVIAVIFLFRSAVLLRRVPVLRALLACQPVSACYFRSRFEKMSFRALRWIH